MGPPSRGMREGEGRGMWEGWGGMMMEGLEEGPRAAMLEECSGVPWGDGDSWGVVCERRVSSRGERP